MLAAKKLKRLSRSRSSTPSPCSSARTSPYKCIPGTSGTGKAVLKMGNSLANALKRESKRQYSSSKSPTPSPCSSTNNSPIRDSPRANRATRRSNIDSLGHSPLSSRILYQTSTSESKNDVTRTGKKANNSPSSPSYIKAPREFSSLNRSPKASHSVSHESSVKINGSPILKRLEKNSNHSQLSSLKTSSLCNSPVKPSAFKGGNSLQSPDTGRQSRSKSSGSCSSKSSRKAKFSVGQDVLARWSDGLFYLGNILKVAEKDSKCLVSFEDDSEHWVLYKDLQKGAKEGDIISCCLCQNDSSESPNEIVLCDNCGLGYHQECHNPTIDSDVLQEDVEWCCRLCIFAATVKRGGALKIGPEAKALQKMKQTFPYDMNKLTWDAQRKTNVEQYYCYCGGPGDWYLKMLQCCRCKQWFHEACIQCLDRPLMNGDRFYLFVCSHCNSGPEYIKRIDLKWVDIIHLALFNLTLYGVKKYYDLDILLPYINSNWKDLQVGKLASTSEEEREKCIIEALKGNKSRRFLSGCEIKLKKKLWGLRMRAPPPGPTIILPVEGQINEEVMNTLQMTGGKTKCFVPIHCNSPVPLKSKKAFDNSIAFKSNRATKQLLQTTVEHMEHKPYSSNQEYQGYNGMLGKGTCSSPTKTVASSTKTVKKLPERCLESYIPVPNSFEGHNHPFKTDLEQKEEFAKYRRKVQIMNYLYQSCDSDTASQSSLCSGLSASDDPTKLIPTPPPSVTSSQSVNDSLALTETSSTSSRSNGKGKKRKLENGTELESDVSESTTAALRRSKRSRLSISGRYSDSNQNVIDARMIEQVKSQVVNMDRIKSNINSFFGAADRLKKGERYEVLGKRVTPEGNVQYLVSWEGLVP